MRISDWSSDVCSSDLLYNGAMNAVAAYNWEAAAKGFDEVERQHPYSVWATKAEIMGAYAYYQQNKYTDAVSAAQRFLQLHPGNKDAPYAYYQIGRATSELQSLMRISYAVFCLKKKLTAQNTTEIEH